MSNRRTFHNRIFGYIPDKVRSYALFISWLVPDSIWRYKGISLAVLITGFLGVTFQLQVFFVIIHYARHFSSGELITIVGNAYDPRTSLGLLSAGSLLVAVSLALSALCIYFSKRNILRIGRLYEEFCSRRVFYLLGEKSVFPDADNNSSIDTYLGRLVRADARLCGRVLRMLLSLIIPGLTLAVAATVLFYLEPALTMIIVTALVFYTFFQYRISNRAAAYSVEFEKMSALAGQDYKGLLRHFKQQFSDSADQKLVDKTFTAGPVKRQLDAYEDRLRMPDASEFVSGIFTALIVGIIILVMGRTIIEEGHGWGRLLVYILALRYAMTNLQSSFSIITSINRFYPQARRHHQFVRNAGGESEKIEQFEEIYNLRIDDTISEKLLDGTQVSGTLTDGTRLALVTSLGVNRYNVAALMKPVLGKSERVLRDVVETTSLITASPSCPHASLRKILGLTSGETWNDLRASFPDEQSWKGCMAQLPGNLDKPITPALWDKLYDKSKVMLGFLAAKQTSCRWAVIEIQGLQLFENREAQFFLDNLRNRIVVVVFSRNLNLVGSFGESLVAVTEENAVLGLGTPEWFAGIREEVKEMLGLHTKATIIPDEEPEDLEDE